MKIVDNVSVIRSFQIWKSINTVIIIPSNQNTDIRGDIPDTPDTFPGNMVPCVRVFPVCNLIKQFKSKHIRICGISLGELFPQPVKTFLQFFIFKKARLPVVRIKRIAVCFMQIQHHIQAIFFTPENCFFNILEAFFQIRPVRSLNKIVINRDAHMIQTPACNNLKVLFSDKCAVMSGSMDAL